MWVCYDGGWGLLGLGFGFWCWWFDFLVFVGRCFQFGWCVLLVFAAWCLWFLVVIVSCWLLRCWCLLVVGVRFRVAVWVVCGFWCLLSFVRWVRFRWLLLVVFVMVFAVWGVRWGCSLGCFVSALFVLVGWHVLWGCLGGLRFVDFVLRVVSADF